MRLEIPFQTFVRIFAAALIAFCAIKIWGLAVLALFSILIAVTLRPLRARLASKLPQWAATSIVALCLVGTVVLTVSLLMPALISQIAGVISEWPHMRERILASLPQDRLIRPLITQIVSNPGISVGGKLSEHLLTLGGMAIGGISELVLLLTLSVYLLAEGKQTYDWFLAFFKPEIRFKLHQTAREVTEVISAYVAGQFITSVLVAIYSFTVLRFLKVPEALMLASIAGLFDILPIIGFFLSTIPAVLLALTVSAKAAIVVFAAYLFYHGVENYLIVPRIYGNKLRLSTLAVMLALLTGGAIAGIPGAILVLPLAASYPIVERIWLKRYLGSDVVEKHVAAADDSQKSA